MSEQTNEKGVLTPRLRFPEFRDAGEWAKKTLADVCLRITNGKANAEDHEDKGIYPLFDRSEGVKKSSKFAFDDQAVIIPGEGMRFQPKYYQGKFNLHQRAYALMQHRGNARFVYYTLDRFKETLAKNAVKSTVLSLRLPIIERFVLAVPCADEQQKIADCLTSLDELIAAESQKLDALKTHKKGLMQQLFPREGETVPRLRFPEFREAGEWTTESLSKIARITQGGTPSTSVPEYWNGEVQWITPAEMGKDVSPYISRTVRALTQDGLRNCSSELLPEGSIILSTRAPIGHLAINTVPMAINQGCRGIVVNANHDSKFVYYHLGHSRSRLEDIGAGNTFKELSGSALKEFVLCTPTKAEQQKIADSLSSLDDLITAQTKKIAALKTHKKGLMQQLFPVLDEVQP